MRQYDPRLHGALCENCPLFGQPTVPPDMRNPDPTFVMVGEGPGRNEVKEGRPFVGKSGKEMNQYLAAVGLRRDDAVVTNATLCLPNTKTDKEMKAATLCCRPRLLKEIANLPGPVLALGKWALYSLTGEPSIDLNRGYVREVANDGVLLRRVWRQDHPHGRGA